MTTEPWVITFFDLGGLCITRTGGTVRLRPGIARRLADRGRFGILTNAPRGLGREGLAATLSALGIEGHFAPTDVIDAAALPIRLPDPRAFAAAAALAGTTVERCLYVTARPELADGARAAGMGAELIGRRSRDGGPAAHGSAGRRAAVAGETEGARSAPAGVRGGAAAAGREAAAAGRGAAIADRRALSLIDEDTGPVFVLEGRIVTLDRRGVIDGRVAVQRGRIAAIVPAGAPLPRALSRAPVVRTDGTIYPGLIDLHNHFVYDIAPLWRVPRRYHDRSQWADVSSKKAEVSLPVKLLAGWPPTAKAIARYVEAKALVAGTTTGQGMKTQVTGGYGPFRGVMRNVESTEDPRLPDAATLVPTLGRRAEDFAGFRAALAKRAAVGGAYFYHLAEGTEHIALRTYTDLRDNGLLQAPLAGIHCLGLGASDLADLRAADAKLVWSPFSNLLLYGQTLDLAALLRSGLRFAIGSDWTPSGSRNLLEELKVARIVARSQGVDLGAERLVRAVTVDAAAILGWADRVGAVRVGAFADLLVVRGTDGDPYEQLIDATERDVRLVTVHGVPRYGDRALMEALLADPGAPLEPWVGGGFDTCFQLASPASPINGLRVDDATTTLRQAMSDLPAFRDIVAAGIDRTHRLGVAPADTFTLLLDNEPAWGPGDGMGMGAADDASLLPAHVELDAIVVGGDDYWSRVADQPNLDQGLKDSLRAAYPA